ncbi:MotB family protein [Methylosinus sp. Sm6]|uniref:MotB family protein n=1 Tax=Methylosinus sp. Sm6 TaxID=2866948 RepID=UPI001C99A78D|nr:MotB family protein [Methylosinus sp. Sm6]MBY6242151.1 MotB family protein [Methylosinus sp. Sm6]
MSDEEESEIIFIRKRHGNDEEGHHGGAWKIAFADFMTAMMAFFLVMWIINSTSKETKAAIVQYFNPVQLVDSNPAHKGLRDPKDGGQGKSTKESNVQERQHAGPAAASEKDEPLREAALLYDPMSTLDEIAGPAAANSTDASGKPGQAPPTFGDPFDRSMRGVGYVEQRLEESGSPDKASEAEPAEERAKPAATTPPTNAKSATRQQRQAASAAAAAAAAAAEEKARAEAAQVEAARAAIEKIVKAESASAQPGPHVEVAQTSEGLLISLTDEANFSMFAIGSVKPKPQLVRIIGQIGSVLSKQPGQVELRGHTDGRSYKSKVYDNWRLSADRANMAYYMLLRGGLSEKRVVKIAGYADRNLKEPKEPLSAVNRRIEILVRKGGP